MTEGLATLDLERTACPAGRRPGRSVRARHHLSARLGDGPLRFPLRVLHGGGHDVPAQGRSAQPRGARSPVRRLHRQGRAQAAAHRRRAAGAARDHDAGRLAVAPSRRPARSTSSPSPPTARSSPNTPPSSRVTASSASTSRSTRSIPTSSAPSPAGASSTRSMAGIAAAQAAGLQVKINAVALKGVNEDELGDLVAWAHGRGMDLTIIEVMPLGDIGAGRLEQYLPLSLVRARLAQRYTLDEIDYRTGGPARFVRVKETGGRLGFITPLTHNFCESCNRVRLTCTGTLYMCLGPGGRRRPAHAVALVAAQCPARRRHRRGDLAQAQGARFHHRPPPPAPGAVAPHERDRRVSCGRCAQFAPRAGRERHGKRAIPHSAGEGAFREFSSKRQTRGEAPSSHLLPACGLTTGAKCTAACGHDVRARRTHASITIFGAARRRALDLLAHLGGDVAIDRGDAGRPGRSPPPAGRRRISRGSPCAAAPRRGTARPAARPRGGRRHGRRCRSASPHCGQRK